MDKEREALEVIARLTAPGNRTMDELMRDMDLACDVARAALQPERIEGFVHVCTLPDSLGAVTGLSVKSERVIVETESGVDFIVPDIPKQQG